MNIQKFRVKRNKKIYVFLFCLSLFGIFSLYRELNAQVDPSFLIKPEGESSIKIETPTFGSYTFEQGLPLAFKKGKPFYFTESSNPIALLIITLVNWGLRLSGILLFGVLVYTGIVYATSSGNPKKIEQAKARLFESLIGFFLLFSFYIILNTINPDILTVSTEAPITITPPSSEEDLEGPSPETTPPSPPAPENYVDIKSLNLPLTDELKSYPNVWLDV
ncbi:MAG: pilin, partial [Candidatus Paceibacterota bacterium]